MFRRTFCCRICFRLGRAWLQSASSCLGASSLTALHLSNTYRGATQGLLLLGSESGFRCRWNLPNDCLSTSDVRTCRRWLPRERNELWRKKPKCLDNLYLYFIYSMCLSLYLFLSLYPYQCWCVCPCLCLVYICVCLYLSIFQCLCMCPCLCLCLHLCLCLRMCLCLSYFLYMPMSVYNRPFAGPGHVTYPPLNLRPGTLWVHVAAV